MPSTKPVSIVAALFTTLSLLLSGCSSETAGPTTNGSATTTAATSEHGEWWCNEHGVPEEVCALCDVKLVADFKAKGDWCQEHARPDSQCFVCHPEKEAEFAALYKAKYGKNPPKPTAEKHDHDHK